MSLQQEGFTKDFGSFGETYPIKEEDGRLTMLKSASRVDWSKINNDLKDQAVNYFTDLMGTKSGSVEQYHIAYFDLTITATKDILGPIIQNGEIEWVTVVEKGKTVNPVDHIPSNLYTAYIDLKDESQVELLEQLIHKHKKEIRVVGINGNPKLASEKLGRMVYFATTDQIDQEKVKFTPTFSWPSFKDGIKQMAYAAIPYPYDHKLVLEVLGK